MRGACFVLVWWMRRKLASNISNVVGISICCAWQLWHCMMNGFLTTSQRWAKKINSNKSVDNGANWSEHNSQFVSYIPLCKDDYIYYFLIFYDVLYHAIKFDELRNRSQMLPFHVAEKNCHLRSHLLNLLLQEAVDKIAKTQLNSLTLLQDHPGPSENW